MGWKNPFMPAKDLFSPRIAKRKVGREARKAVARNQAKQRQQAQTRRRYEVTRTSVRQYDRNRELTKADIVITLTFFMVVAIGLIWVFS